MLAVDTNDLQVILEGFGIREKVVGAEELLRYDYKNDPAGKNVRLMLKCLFADREPAVVKLKHEADVTEALLAEQIEFSERLAACGIQTAGFCRAGEAYVICRTLHDYEVLITVEEFCSGEITVVTPGIAEQTGRLLGVAHGIAQRDDCHVHGAVPFDFNRCGDNILFCDAVITAFWMNRDDILPLDQIAERIERDLAIDL